MRSSLGARRSCLVISHRTDGYVENDTVGTELDDLGSARVQAVIFAGESLKEEPNKVWSGQDFRVEVTDEAGRLLFTVVTQAIDSPAMTRELRKPPLL